LEKYEKEKYQKAANELGKSTAGVQKRVKELGIGN
jgi:hypothetical protein